MSLITISFFIFVFFLIIFALRQTEIFIFLNHQNIFIFLKQF